MTHSHHHAAVIADPVRSQLIALLDGGQAHATFEEAVRDFPVKQRGVLPAKLPYSAWQLVEHIRITQKDILDFSSPPAGAVRELKWPDEYWPKEKKPPTAGSWDHSVVEIKRDLEKFKALILDPEADLAAPFPWGSGQNLLREAMLLADHTSYHIGELVLVRRLLVIWHK